MPGLAAFVLAGVLRAALGRERGGRLAAAGAGLGLIAAYLLIVGPPPLPPVSSLQKLFYVVAGGLLLGAVLDLLRDPWLLRWPLLLGVLFGVVYWLGLPRLEAGPSTETTVVLAALFAASLVALARLDSLREKMGIGAPVLLLVASVGLAAVAFLGHTTSIAQLALALGAALAGSLLWNWPKPRFAIGASVLFGLAVPLFALADVLVLFARPSLAAVAILVLVFFADLAARQVEFKRGPLASAVAPLWLGAVALVPVGAAIGVAWLAGQN